MTKKYQAQLDDLIIRQQIHEADLEHEEFRRRMTRQMAELDARAERMLNEMLAAWAAEDAEIEAAASKQEIRDTAPAPGEEPFPEPDWAGLSYNDYVKKIRPGLDIDSKGQGGLFW
ncbi:MAG: hypothetical protein ACRDRJ_00780 [Streptosporangiaceae bacterium]